ncbi:MAG: hypothetical protein ACKO8I_15205 [Cyanobacteriota bacterium]
MLLRVALASNAIQLEAARRLHDCLRPAAWGLDILLYEPDRIQLDAADCRRWPVRLHARPLSYGVLLPWAAVGRVGELWLSHLSHAGRGLRLLAHRARALVLLDDGLDQYRSTPKAIDPQTFAADTPCWLFSDAPPFRADWCRRFACRELGPLYSAADRTPRQQPADPLDPLLAGGTLIIDSPGVERLQARSSELPHPWVLIPHPVAAKRSWSLPLQAGDRELRVPPETLLPQWSGTVLVGESLMLLAALRLCGGGSRVRLSLPEDVDPQLLRLSQAAAEERPQHLTMR